MHRTGGVNNKLIQLYIQLVLGAKFEDDPLGFHHGNLIKKKLNSLFLFFINKNYP